MSEKKRKENLDRWLERKGWRKDGVNGWTHPEIQTGNAVLDSEAAYSIQNLVADTRRANPLERIADALEAIREELGAIEVAIDSRK